MAILPTVCWELLSILKLRFRPGQSTVDAAPGTDPEFYGRGVLPDQGSFQVFEKGVVNQAIGFSWCLMGWRLLYHLNGVHN